MKVKVGNQKAFVFILLAAVILGVMLGTILINNKKAQADKNYIDSQKQKLEVENRVSSETTNTVVTEGNDNENVEIEEVDGIKINPTMLDNLSGNSAYCPTFQIVWNELANMYVDGKDVVFLNKKLEMIDNLNKKTFTKDDISDEYYYVKVGKMVLSVKKEIEKGIKDKFDETSKILDMVEWIDDSNLENIDNIDEYVFYTMLKRNFEFNKPFDILDEDGLFGEYKNVKYFGIDEESDKDLRKQIDVLYYNNQADFAVKLKTKDNDEIIVLRKENDNFKTFDEVYTYLNNQTEKYKGNKEITENDFLKVPNIKFDVLKKYDELRLGIFLDKDNNEKVITEAIQTIEFEIDNKGGKLKSEALIAVKNTSIMIGDEPIENRYFYCNDDFYMFLKEENKDKPYFALKVDDIKDFQEDVIELDIDKE